MIRTVRQSFAAGELAPELHMRSDLSAYQKGAARLSNMIVRRTGSAAKRPGTDLLDVGDMGMAYAVRMFPFYYDVTTSFVLLVTPTLIRVVKVSPEFALDRDFEWESDWSADNVAAMRVKQVGDTLFCSAPGCLPVRLVRDADDGDWTVLTERKDGPPSYTQSSGVWSAVWDGPETTPYRFIRYGLWVRDVDGQVKKLWSGLSVQVASSWPAGATVQFTISRSSVPADAVGDEWVLCKFYGGEYGEIGSHLITSSDRGTGSTIMFEDLNIIPSSQIGSQTDIRADDDAGGYGLIEFYQQRQVLAGNPNAPWTLWFSRLADLYMWTANRPSDAMDPFRGTIAASRASEIIHLVAGRRLLIFTSDGVYAAHSGADGFAWNTCQIERVNPCGAGTAEPIDTGASVLFFASDDRTLLEMRYSFAEDAHVSTDRSVLARHLTESASITRAAWQAWPDGVLWVVLDDGSLLSFTYLPEHEVYAFARHAITLTGTAQSAFVADIVATGSILRDNTTMQLRHDATTATVILAFDGSTDPIHYFLLRMRPGGRANDACLDCTQQRYRDVGAEEFSITLAAGDMWRMGYVLAEAAWQTADSDIEVAVPEMSWIEWGTPVVAELQTLKPESPELPTQAMRRRVVSVTVRTLDSGAYSVSDAVGGPETAVTGDNGHAAAHDAKIPPITGWDWDGRVKITSASADKLEVLGVITDMEIERGQA